MRSFSSAARLASASLRALSSAAAWVRCSRVRMQHARIQGYVCVLFYDAAYSISNLIRSRCYKARA